MTVKIITRHGGVKLKNSHKHIIPRETCFPLPPLFYIVKPMKT